MRRAATRSCAAWRVAQVEQEEQAAGAWGAGAWRWRSYERGVEGQAARLQRDELQPSDGAQLREAERVEDDHLVQPIEKLGAILFAQRVEHALSHRVRLLGGIRDVKT